MSEEAVVIYVPHLGYLTDNLIYIWVDNADKAMVFPSAAHAERQLDTYLFEDDGHRDSYEIITLAAARAQDDQDYEAEREEML